MARPQTFVSLILISATVFFSNFRSSDAKIDPTLQEIYDNYGTADVLVEFVGGNEQVIKDIESMSFPSREEKVKALVYALEELASKTQDPITNGLKAWKVDSKSFWISNQMVIRNVPSYVLYFVDSFPQVRKIGKLSVFESSRPIEDSERVKSATVKESSWGVGKIQADQVVVNGISITGQMVLVANIDTGVRGTHEALKGTWLEGGWFDPDDISESPNDENGHGTHTMGIIAGNRGIGVAPGVQWMACIGCPQKRCKTDLILQCAEWMLKSAPKIPDIINNSWGGRARATTPSSSFDSALASWRTAGILPVFSNGNLGRTGCSTVSYPASLATVFGVGATAQNDSIADFSSRGPGVEGVELNKPDISAPGDQITSAWPDSDSSYHTDSGTSIWLLLSSPEC